MSAAKASGIKGPSKIGRPPGPGAPKTNPSTGKHVLQNNSSHRNQLYSITF